MNVITISAVEVHKRRSQGEPVDLVDVRTPVEFREVHAESARNVPLDTFHPKELLDGEGDGAVYLICHTGSRARKAAEKCGEHEGGSVYVVEGGTEAWVGEGLPVVRGKKAISLERQVRIAAGALVLIGSLLAFVVSPYFMALPAFVGAGLVFAGVTDTCGMGILLSKMPWNQVNDRRDGRGES